MIDEESNEICKKNEINFYEVIFNTIVPSFTIILENNECRQSKENLIKNDRSKLNVLSKVNYWPKKSDLFSIITKPLSLIKTFNQESHGLRPFSQFLLKLNDFNFL